MVIALSSASQVIASGVCPNESEDLVMSGFNIGMPPLEDAREDVSPMF